LSSTGLHLVASPVVPVSPGAILTFVAEVTAAYSTLLAHLAENRPGFPDGAPV